MRVLAVAAVLLLAGCSGGDEGPWHGRELDATDPPWRSKAIEAEGSIEVNLGQRDPGDVLEWDWFVMERVAVDFDLHSHASSGVRYHERLNAVQDTGTHEVETPGAYSYTFVNRNDAPVELWFRVDGGVVT